MSSNTFLFNAAIRHQIFLQRFAGGEAKGLLKAVDESRKGINDLLMGKEAISMTKRDKDTLMAKVSALLKSTYGEQNQLIFKNMKDFSQYEAEFGERMLQQGTQTAITGVSKTALNKAVFKTGIDFGVAGIFTIQSALGDFSRRKQKQAVQVIRDGIGEGLTNQEIRRKMNTVVSVVNQNHAKTLIRTITNHVATGARVALFDDNKDVIKSIKWTSVLDGRTTPICRSLDGKVFQTDKGPRPPVHWSCRSTITAIVKEEFDVIPGVKTKRFARGPAGKQSVDGRVNYNSWLKTQPKSFQEEVLGIDKAALFRKGGLSMDKFVDKNFKELSLDELKIKEPLAFDKADID